MTSRERLGAAAVPAAETAWRAACLLIDHAAW